MDSIKKYVAYYRASTEKQRDGLGLDAQKTAVSRFVSHYGGEVLASFEEIISGGANLRVEFDNALAACKELGAILLVHRIDRLSRGGFVALAKLEEQGIPYIEADSPFDSEFSKQIKFLIAKEERDKIKTRVKDSLAEIKAKIAKDGFYITKEGKRITSLGSPSNMDDAARKKSAEVRKLKARANLNNKKAYSVFEEMRKDGAKYSEVANFLNRHGFVSARGGKFYEQSVRNLEKLYSDD